MDCAAAQGLHCGERTHNDYSDGGVAMMSESFRLVGLFFYHLQMYKVELRSHESTNPTGRSTTQYEINRALIRAKREHLCSAAKGAFIKKGAKVPLKKRSKLPYAESMKCDIASTRSLPLNVSQNIKNQVPLLLPQGSNETIPNDPRDLT
jgi:hypothetical protein